MAVEKEEYATTMATIRNYCPKDGSRLVYKESLTEFPEYSGWECPECGFVLYDE